MMLEAEVRQQVEARLKVEAPPHTQAELQLETELQPPEGAEADAEEVAEEQTSLPLEAAAAVEQSSQKPLNEAPHSSSLISVAKYSDQSSATHSLPSVVNSHRPHLQPGYDYSTATSSFS
jgi:hypothetical protein